MRNVNERDQEKASVAAAKERSSRYQLAHEKALAVGDSDALAIDAIVAERGCSIDEAIAIFVGETD